MTERVDPRGFAVVEGVTGREDRPCLTLTVTPPPDIPAIRPLVTFP
jgi:hypothetical protein